MESVIGLLIVIGVLAIAGWFILRIFKKRGEFSHSLGLGLIKIQLPKAKQEENQQKTTANDVREKIAMMEQVYAQLATIRDSGMRAWLYGKPSFSFELAVPYVGQEVFFYLAVPRRHISSAEKLIQGVYPDANVERVTDYTIFHPQGSVSVATGRSKSRFLPLKTFQTLDADPLGSILNAFSKIAHEGEGMALQIVARKAPRSWNKEILKIGRHLREGKTLSKAIYDSKKTIFGRTLKAALITKNKDEEDSRSNEERSGIVNDALTQIVEKKGNKVLFEANIRLVACAPTKERSDSLLQEMMTPMAQFTNEETNALYFSHDHGRSAQKTIYQYAFRVPDRGSRIILSSEELTSIIHMPNTMVGAANIASVKAKSAPVPANIPREGIVIGKNIYRGVETEIRIKGEDRLRHFYIIGQTGTGKTYIMRNMIIQDIEAGRGVCFIDPHGDMAEEILGCIPPNRIKDVIYFNPGDVSRPMGLNMLEFDEKFPEQKTFVINELLEIFNKLYDMKTAGGPMFEQYFRNATGLVMEDPASGNTLLEINRVFVDKKFRDYKLAHCNNPLVKTFWREVAEKAGGDASLQNIVPYISSKFDSFLSNEIMRPIVAQEKSAFKLREVMDNQKILLINLSKGRLGELNSSLIGLIMVGKILMAAFSRGDIAPKDRKDFFLYADEFQNVATTTIETILSEARKYRLGLIIAHQFIAQLEDDIKDAVFGNVGSMAAFRVGAEDGEFLEKQFGPTFTQADLINIDNQNCYVKMLINGQTATPFSMKTITGMKSNPEIAEKAKEFSRLTYGRDRKLVEEEVMEKFKTIETAKAPPKPASPF